MRINQDKCVACLECIDYCPVEAIKEDPAKGEVFIDEDECVECGCCLKADVCPCEAIWQPELDWRRRLRAEFSDASVPHPLTGVRGRGTEEMKTNDVTARYPRGRVGIAAELGRPGMGTRLRDVEKVIKTVIPFEVDFEKDNPVYALIADLSTGKLKEEVLNEKVLSAIVEFSITPDKVPAVLKALKEVSQEVGTVFSVDMCSLLEPDGTCPAENTARSAGFEIRPNGKNNIGLGRPLARL
ncbi:MAG: 4Fe-4S binding protein [Deltaproteobacteria bacterium]|nr:4Fe-4S binding protein [Deltaproteobacteria bacterium]